MGPYYLEARARVESNVYWLSKYEIYTKSRKIQISITYILHNHWRARIRLIEKKIAIIAVIVTLSIAGGYYAYMTKPFADPQSFPDPTSGKEIYENLEALGCHILRSDSQYPSRDLRLQNYQDFLQVAKGNTAYLFQRFSKAQYTPYAKEYITLLAINNEQRIVMYLYYEFEASTLNALDQMILERSVWEDPLISEM